MSAGQSRERVHVALGSNLGDRAQLLSTALHDIAGLTNVSNLICSSLYETEPMGPQDQPDYLNAVCGFDYGNTPRVLLEQLQAIERQHGRQAGGRRWGERPLDLDIVLFGQHLIHEADLIVPHAGLAERSFVLWPLAELDTSLVVPGMSSGEGLITELQQRCQQFGIRRVAGNPLATD